MIFNILAVGAGGFIGSILRYLVGLIKLDENFIFPIKTLSINIIGCFCIGLIVALALNGTNMNERTMLFLKVGICGGFTTLSAFAVESIELFQTGHQWMGILYIVLSITLSLIAVLAAENIIGIKS